MGIWVSKLLMRRTSRTGLDFISGGVCSIAHTNMDDRYLRRLFAAPGLSFFKSRSVLTVCDVSRCSGQKPAGLPSFAIDVSAKHDSMTPRRMRCERASRAKNSSDPKYLTASHPSVPGGHTGLTGSR
jgi:hypothetical protein